MAPDGLFVDYYMILGVAPNCSQRALEKAYHSLAKRYHPDHADEADVAKFTEVVEAYKALKDASDRAAYDTYYAEVTGFSFQASDEQPESEKSALSDADAHARILQLLYKQRREQPHSAGIGHYLLQQSLRCSDELFEFHTWYLKEKGLINVTEQGTLAITIQGVDHVILTSRTAMKEKLFLEQSGGVFGEGRS